MKPTCPVCGSSQIAWLGYTKPACVYGHGLAMPPRPIASDRAAIEDREREEEAMANAARIARIKKRSRDWPGAAL